MKHAHLVKQDWLSRAIEISRFHAQCCLEDSSWTIPKTAQVLNRSVGSISNDLKIASWSKTHEKQLKRCDSLRGALLWIKQMEGQRLREDASS